MIQFILQELRRQGVVIPEEAGTAAMVAAHATYGGERIYVPRTARRRADMRGTAATLDASDTAGAGAPIERAPNHKESA